MALLLTCCLVTMSKSSFLLLLSLDLLSLFYKFRGKVVGVEYGNNTISQNMEWCGLCFTRVSAPDLTLLLNAASSAVVLQMLSGMTSLHSCSFIYCLLCRTGWTFCATLNFDRNFQSKLLQSFQNQRIFSPNPIVSPKLCGIAMYSWRFKIWQSWLNPQPQDKTFGLISHPHISPHPLILLPSLSPASPPFWPLFYKSFKFIA
jgi:hypothetical protein